MVRINNTQYFRFLEQADALRRSGSLCDAIISVESQTFKAHRLVLACASRRLAQQLARGDEDSPVHCTLELLSSKTFQQVLDFTYTQALDVSMDDLHLLLRAARVLEMQPLEDQCQKQLDTLDCSAREDQKRGEMTALKEADETGQQLKPGPIQKKKFQENSARNEAAIEQFHDLAKGYTSLQPPRKRLRLSSMSASPHSRDSVITRPVTSHSSLSSPWSLPSNMWSPVNTLRQMAQNYSNLMAAHSLQSSPQPLAYPFSFSAPRMLPLLASSFPSPVHSSVMGHSGRHQHYTQSLHARPPRMESIIKQGLLRQKKLSQRALTGAIQTSEPRNPEVHKDGTETVKDRKHGHKRLHGDALLQEADSTPGEACTGCSFYGGGDAVPYAVHSRRHDNRGEKPYQCQHCPKKFSLKHQLDTHHRVHTGEKPFECRLCGQRSRDYSAMIKHLRTHGGAAPYQCTVCLEFCSSQVAMQRHVKGHAVQDFPPDWDINSTYLYTSHV
ncbi:zinc finger and BTB domain-containing protein 32 isoform X2 [Genypterus blacodes]|uniref:zinc finger and BTB domain-containing protein 32 isoform X2 n=1 Tax=Genypterus blacodes TaxID=154954 RepID=UPI003F76F67C